MINYLSRPETIDPNVPKTDIDNSDRDDSAERMKSFPDRVKTWSDIKTGKPVDDKLARTTYYLRFLLDDVVEKVKASAHHPDFSNVKYLILPVGMSVEPLCIVYNCVQPQKVFLLSTRETAGFVDLFVDHFKLKPSQFQTFSIDADKPVSFYEKIREIQREIPRGSSVLVDISGGKKSMVAAVASAGFTIGARVSYVDNTDYIPDLRIPRPGKEFMIEICNPAAILGDIQSREIAALFNHLHFSAAEGLCTSMAKVLSNPLSLETLGFACRGFEAWQNFQFDEARNQLTQFSEKSRQFRKLNNLNLRVEGKLSALHRLLAKGDETSLFSELIRERNAGEASTALDAAWNVLLTLFVRASDECGLKRNFDAAALLFYRTWEMYQQILFAHHYGVLTKDMHYEKLGLPIEKLESLYRDVACDIFSAEKARCSLPKDVPLFSGAILLHILGVGGLFAEKAKLMEVKEMTENRNSSKFAHGFSCIKAQEAKKMQKLVKAVFFNFPGRKKVGLEEELEPHRFCQLEEDDLLF